MSISRSAGALFHDILTGIQEAPPAGTGEGREKAGSSGLTVASDCSCLDERFKLTTHEAQN